MGVEMGITQSQLKYQTLFSRLDLIGCQRGHGGHKDHTVTNEKSKKGRKYKEYKNQNKYHGNFLVEIKMGIRQSQLHCITQYYA